MLWYLSAMASPKLNPDMMVTLAAASCKITQAIVEKIKAHKSEWPKLAPALEAVVTVPGPIKAAETTDQNSILKSRDLKVFPCFIH